MAQVENGMLFKGVWLPPREAHLLDHIKRNPIYEGKGTYQWNKLTAAVEACAQRRVALDVGAHVGLWSHPLSFMFGRLIAWEPLGLHADLWDANMEARPNVELHRCALSYAAGVTRLHVDQTNSGATHQDAGRNGGEEVPTRRLDDFGIGVADLLKIDCEGGEEGVLRGGEFTIRRCNPVVIVEQKYGHAERAGFKKMGAVDLLKSWGWTAAREIAGDFIMLPPK